jgi:flavin-dependent thymidylate synthase
MSGEIQRWADVAMFEAMPGIAIPEVTLVAMTPRPLQVMAAASELYRGRVFDFPEDVTREQCEYWFTEMTRTRLQAPLEFIDLHFLIEGVTRAFTHQLVRQRTGVYIQESMRFAVKTNAMMEVAYPPSIAGLPDDHPLRVMWDKSVMFITTRYNDLVNAGVPAEDARGLLPTNITTRIHYKTNLRNLAEQAGLRLCSQAQYEWKQVWDGIIRAILDYGPQEDHWQQIIIAKMFRPICYTTGRCEFRGDNDRHCVIRERVEGHYARGEAPDQWDDINPLEPLLEGAARVGPGR